MTALCTHLRETKKMMTPSTPFTPMNQFRPFVVTSQTPAAPVESPTIRLARKAGAGDAQAMRLLLREIGPRIERVVRAVLGRANEDADDVIQQAMMGFVQALPSFRGECEPVHFASRVAARTAIACARRRRALSARHEDGVELDTIAHEQGAVPEPLATTERTRRMELLRDVLAQIPPEQAETLSLRVVLGWSLAEIADTMGCPLNTVRSRLRLAKTALRSVIQSDPTAQEELGDG
jgi:RNA polymerase sigma-70 factor (ECF subfamily)